MEGLETSRETERRKSSDGMAEMEKMTRRVGDKVDSLPRCKRVFDFLLANYDDTQRKSVEAMKGIQLPEPDPDHVPPRGHKQPSTEELHVSYAVGAIRERANFATAIMLSPDFMQMLARESGLYDLTGKDLDRDKFINRPRIGPESQSIGGSSFDTGKRY